METRHMVELVKPYLNAMQNPKNPLHDVNVAKKKRGVDWQEASHGWAEQNNQPYMCAVSQSSSK